MTFHYRDGTFATDTSAFTLLLAAFAYEAKPVIAVWFSCGAASAVAAKLTIERYGATHDVRLLNNFVLEEDGDNRRFLREVSEWLGYPVEQVAHPDYPNCSAVEIFDLRKFMSSPKGAPCTMLLKRGARQHWEQTHDVAWHVMGFTAEEEDRHDNFILTERDNLLPVLIDAGLTKQDCFDICLAAGLTLPRMYLWGYPNANCVGCVKVNSPTYWNHVRRVHPEVFAARAEQSRRLGVRLVRVRGAGKGERTRIFLDELSPDYVGGPMKSLKMPDCGIFCEEKPRFKLINSSGTYRKALWPTYLSAMRAAA
ncbi:hypothetical protein AEAC466_04585 [Asticcacaulis sp. AC466]|uniref:hypothetical protein n=1 Tax=Asticcacaulis sp. AC466 TaxID=1282362 RepID=UPI0003C3F322|nr:hypothetical protein [Asticcacaulis sp. AC466]ESQ85446.1 hypothetical protein AEAC466_04585 [Asticcacaulis sp. AC466]